MISENSETIKYYDEDQGVCVDRDGDLSISYISSYSYDHCDKCGCYLGATEREISNHKACVPKNIFKECDKEFVEYWTNNGIHEVRKDHEVYFNKAIEIKKDCINNAGMMS